MHGSRADAKCLCRFEDAWAGRQLCPDLLDDMRADRTAAEALALCSGTSEASIDPAANHRPLELGECPCDLVEQPTCRRRGVDVLLIQKQIAPDRL